MAARRGTLAAGAARASGERARRRTTPLIGAEPVVVAPETGDAGAGSTPAAAATAPSTDPTKKSPAATPTRTSPAEKPTAKKAPAKKSAARKAAARTPTAKKPTAEKPAPATPVEATPKASGPTTPTGGTASGTTVPGTPTPETTAPDTTVPDTSASDATVAALPTAPPARRPHRPAPRVTSAPSRAASRQAGERRSTAKGAAGRRPRVDPREKARRDAARPHLRIAEPPLDPTVHEAPSRTGLPLPDLGDALDAAVGLLRMGAEAAGIAPEDVERRVAQVLAYIRRRVDGDYEVDDFGYDADFTEHVFYPLLRPIYRHWFRVEVRGIENIPATGGALVVSNHSGTIALDSLMVQLAIHDEHPQHRVMRALGADLVFQTPFLGTIARRSGSTLAANEDAERLFHQGELVGVFPEGFKGVGKPFRERYKLQRFGRGGFVAAALSAQVPIIPCSVVGAEEIAPIIGNMGTVARLLGLPYAPITPTFPLLGPLGLIPLPSKWVIEFGAPIATDVHGDGAADDPMLVFDLTDQVRETIQQTLYTLLMQRRSVFF
ncbi:MAG TPA: 1-acyl-sn-glycerol-3-phosphate acyltransferase [Ornithinibacter sp.]|nr:1-acyl-sn-glycerol-3-phosphate acyltransferase [Ornithinibacter sp.]